MVNLLERNAPTIYGSSLIRTGQANDQIRPVKSKVLSIGHLTIRGKGMAFLPVGVELIIKRRYISTIQRLHPSPIDFY